MTSLATSWKEKLEDEKQKVKFARRNDVIFCKGYFFTFFQHTDFYNLTMEEFEEAVERTEKKFV